MKRILPRLRPIWDYDLTQQCLGCHSVKPVMESASPCYKELQPKNFISLAFIGESKCPSDDYKNEICWKMYRIFQGLSTVTGICCRNPVILVIQ